MFNVLKLDSFTTFSHKFENRSVAYYGKYTYTYSGVTHQPRPISDNKYLSSIANYLEIVLPEFKYNSALVHKYIDGQASIPYHSDDEPEIVSDSQIVTVSFGETRTMKFSHKNTGEETSVSLSHGDVLIMDTKSQEEYSHCIPKENCRRTRLSVTFRLLKPLTDSRKHCSQESSLPSTNSTVTQFLVDLNSVNDGYQQRHEAEIRNDVPFYNGDRITDSSRPPSKLQTPVNTGRNRETNRKASPDTLHF